MSSIKIKFRVSSIKGNRGVLYYQIICKRVARQISTSYRIYEYEWDKKSCTLIIGPNSSRSNELFEIRESISQDLKRLRGVIQELDSSGIEYSSDDIVSEYQHKVHKLCFISAIQRDIYNLKLLGKIRTSETYTAALRSLRSFLGDRQLLFDTIDSNLMLRYEAYLRSKHLTMNTISFYMRILRAVYNRGVEENITIHKYPFKHVYTGIDKTLKRAISTREIKTMKEYDFSGNNSLGLARDLFMFSFYTRGMSFVDMAYLTQENLNNGTLIYRRKKTGQLLFIKWESCMQEIVDRYKSSSKYLLPIIRDEYANERKQYLNSLSYTNKKLKKIAKITGISSHLSMYVARHSWASIAKKNRIPISIISEGMGHDSESTTQIYLASLDTSAIDRANHLIIKLV